MLHVLLFYSNVFFHIFYHLVKGFHRYTCSDKATQVSRCRMDKKRQHILYQQTRSIYLFEKTLFPVLVISICTWLSHFLNAHQPYSQFGHLFFFYHTCNDELHPSNNCTWLSLHYWWKLNFTYWWEGGGFVINIFIPFGTNAEKKWEYLPDVYFSEGLSSLGSAVLWHFLDERYSPSTL